MHFIEIATGFFFVVIGQGIQVAYHHYHDKRQNQLLEGILDHLKAQG